MNTLANAIRSIADDEPAIAAQIHTIKIVCPTCDGHGTTWHGHRGTSFTSDEWAQLDYDEQDGYMSGRYDGPCPDCGGKNVIDDVDREGTPADALAHLDAVMSSLWQLAAMEAAERRMGA